MDQPIRLNGQNYWQFDRLENFQQVAKGKYTVEHKGTGLIYTIEGGKALGGTRNDWFVGCRAWAKEIACSSVVDALEMLEGM